MSAMFEGANERYINANASVAERLHVAIVQAVAEETAFAVEYFGVTCPASDALLELDGLIHASDQLSVRDYPRTSL